MKRGYTLIELLISISIIVIIFSIGFASYRNFSRRQTLIGVSKNIVSDLRLLQQKALSGEKPAGCDVLSGYQFNVTTGSSYNTKAICTSEIFLKSVNLTDSGVTISATIEPITFKVLGQGTNLSQASIITLGDNLGNSLTVTVGIGGEIK